MSKRQRDEGWSLVSERKLTLPFMDRAEYYLLFTIVEGRVMSEWVSMAQTCL